MGKIVQLSTGDEINYERLMQDAVDYFNGSEWTRQDLADSIVDDCEKEMRDISLARRNAEKKAQMLAQQYIKQMRGIDIVDVNGQIDRFAIQAMIFSVERGVYIKGAYATVDAINMKIEQILDNERAVVAKSKKERTALVKVRDFMLKNSIRELGAAVKRMGF